jgi:hypothetical protein
MSAWNTPRGVARAAPLEDPHAYLEAWFEIIRLRLEAARASDSEAAERRLRSEHLERALAERVAAAADRPALQIACERLGFANALADIAILVGYELDERIGALASELRISAVASVRRDGSCARALDFIERELLTRGLASITETHAPARNWIVRADRRWLALAAGRLDVDASLPLRITTTPRRVTLHVDGEVTAHLLVREAKILDATVAFRSTPPHVIVSALAAAAIPMIVGGDDE